MPPVKMPASGTTFLIENPALPATFLTISGIESYSHSPSTTDIDFTDLDSGAYEEFQAIRRGNEFTLTGFHKEADDGARDPGQAAVEASAVLVGPAANSDYKIVLPTGTELAFTAYAQVSGPSGGSSDGISWEVMLKVSGAVLRTAPLP